MTHQRVTIVGPNLRDQSRGDFHVHAAGCADLARDPNLRREDQSWTIDAASRFGVAEAIYEDIIAENPGSSAADYVGTLHFAPCVTLAEMSA